MDTTSPDDVSMTRERTAAGMSRYFFVGMALFMTTVVFLGFWPTYFGPLLVGAGFDGHWILHVHAIIYMGWMAVLLAQTTLAARSQMETHMQVGRYGFALGLLVLAMGVILTLRFYQRGVAEGTWTWAEAPFAFWFPLVDMVEFSILLAAGFVYRRRPKVHKRMMYFATIALLHAATGVRMDYLLGPWTTEIMFVLLVGPMYIYDLYVERRVHPATLISTVIVLPDIAFQYVPGLGL
jgi:hypothetical protein